MDRPTFCPVRRPLCKYRKSRARGASPCRSWIRLTLQSISIAPGAPNLCKAERRRPCEALAICPSSAWVKRIGQGGKTLLKASGRDAWTNAAVMWRSVEGSERLPITWVEVRYMRPQASLHQFCGAGRCENHSFKADIKRRSMGLTAMPCSTGYQRLVHLDRL